MNLPNWLFTSFLIFALCLSDRSVDPAIGAPWNVYPVKCVAYFSGAEPIPLGRLFLPY